MPRIRTLKPEILEDEKVSHLSDTAFRLFTSMIVLADDHGNVRADVRWLQAQIWWAHTPPPDVHCALIELWLAGLVTAYSVRGGTYASLLGWAKHQRIDNAGKGRVPSPGDPDASEIDLESGELSALPRNSATRGEMRLDQDQDQEGDQEGDSPRRAASPSPRSSKASGAGCRPRKPSGLPGASGSASELATWKPREAELRLASKLGADVDAEAEKFRDHYLANGEHKADWHACFRGWLRKVDKFSSKSTGTAGSADELADIPEM